VRRITDEFLLHVAEFSVTTIGLFLVGVFFYVETGLRRWTPEARSEFEPYLRAGVRIVLIVFSIPLGLALTLVALDPVWARVTFAALSLALVITNVHTVARLRPATRATGSTALLVNEIVGTVVTVVIVVSPWALGGLHPDRPDFVPAILLSFGIGFFSVGAVVLSTFDVSRVLRPDPTDDRDPTPRPLRGRADSRRRRRVRNL
jgi:hypothetical protein